MGKYLSRLLSGLLALPVLLFSSTFAHIAFNHQMSGMPSNQCQSSCTNSQTPANTATKPQDLIENKDKDPQPVEPYYLAFFGVGWTTAITISAAYLLGYLRWRPPDIFSLYSYYCI